MATEHTRPSQQEPARDSARNPDSMADDTRMSDDQAHRLKALCWQRGERFDDSLTAAEADRRIAELEARG